MKYRIAAVAALLAAALCFGCVDGGQTDETDTYVVFRLGQAEYRLDEPGEKTIEIGYEFGASYEVEYCVFFAFDGRATGNEGRRTLNAPGEYPVSVSDEGKPAFTLIVKLVREPMIKPALVWDEGGAQKTGNRYVYPFDNQAHFPYIRSAEYGGAELRTVVAFEFFNAADFPVSAPIFPGEYTGRFTVSYEDAYEAFIYEPIAVDITVVIEEPPLVPLLDGECVIEADRQLYRRFVVPHNGDYTLGLSYDEDFLLRLFDRNFQVVASNHHSGPGHTERKRFLPAGTYYLEFSYPVTVTAGLRFTPLEKPGGHITADNAGDYNVAVFAPNLTGCYDITPSDGTSYEVFDQNGQSLGSPTYINAEKGLKFYFKLSNASHVGHVSLEIRL